MLSGILQGVEASAVRQGLRDFLAQRAVEKAVETAARLTWGPADSQHKDDALGKVALIDQAADFQDVVSELLGMSLDSPGQALATARDCLSLAAANRVRNMIRRRGPHHTRRGQIVFCSATSGGSYAITLRAFQREWEPMSATMQHMTLGLWG